MATAGENHPTEGIRLILEREELSPDGERATYLALIYTPSERFVYRTELVQGGEASVILVDEPAASEAHHKRLCNLAKSTARAAQRKAAEGLAPWPEHIMRWRGPGRA